MMSTEQTCTNCKPDADWARLGAQHLRDAPDFFGANNLPCKNQKTIRSTSFQSNR